MKAEIRGATLISCEGIAETEWILTKDIQGEKVETKIRAQKVLSIKEISHILDIDETRLERNVTNMKRKKSGIIPLAGIIIQPIKTQRRKLNERNIRRHVPN